MWSGVSQKKCYLRLYYTQESAANVRESAAAQLRLWRECMRRYETVARDVGDTDARLMVWSKFITYLALVLLRITMFYT